MSDEIAIQSVSEMDIINKCTTKLSYEADLDIFGFTNDLFCM